jgi:hypothetical protein
MSISPTHRIPYLPSQATIGKRRLVLFARDLPLDDRAGAHLIGHPRTLVSYGSRLDCDGDDDRNQTCCEGRTGAVGMLTWAGRPAM